MLKEKMTEKRQKSAAAEIEAKNGSIKKTVYYQQKFRQEWKSNPVLQDWLRESEGHKNRAYCRYCKCYLLSKCSDLLTHAKTNKHLRAARLFDEEGDDETTDVKRASSIATSSASAHTAKDNGREYDMLRENKVKTEKRRSSFEVQKLSADNMSDDGECMAEYTIQSDDEEEIAQMVTDVDNEILMSTSSGIPRKLQAERIKAETEYFRQKALYFSKLTENSRVQRTVMILQSRKLHLEIQKLQRDL